MPPFDIQLQKMIVLMSEADEQAIKEVLAANKCSK